MLVVGGPFWQELLQDVRNAMNTVIDRRVFPISDTREDSLPKWIRSEILSQLDMSAKQIAMIPIRTSTYRQKDGTCIVPTMIVTDYKTKFVTFTVHHPVDTHSAEFKSTQEFVCVTLLPLVTST